MDGTHYGHTWPFCQIPVGGYEDVIGSDMSMALDRVSSPRNVVFTVNNPALRFPQLVIVRDSWSKDGWVNQVDILVANRRDVNEEVFIGGFNLQRLGGDREHHCFLITGWD
jgi:hypothetical protein